MGTPDAFPSVILAGGPLDEDLAGVVTVAAKALIPVGGIPMVERLVDALRRSPSIGSVTLVMDAALVPGGVRPRVDRLAVPGLSMLDSVESGLGAVPPDEAERGVLVIPADCPFMSPEAIEDFLLQARSRPADLHYGYLGREDSERAYPGFKHTYAGLKEGAMCGTGLIKMTPVTLMAARRLMAAAVAARKSPWRIAGLLGVGFMVKLLLRRLSVSEAEMRVAELLGCRVVAIRTHYACAGVNVDSAEQWRAAVRFADEGTLNRA